MSVSAVFAVHARPATHLLVSRAVATLPGTELVGAGSSAAEAARVFDNLAPDLLTVDVRLSDGGGIDLARRLRADRPDLRVVLFGRTTDRLLRSAVTAGVSAFLPGRPEVGPAADAIRDSLAGRASFSSRSLAGALRSGRPVGLSRREREVNELILDGLSPVEIAGRLRVSESTVRTYAARARAKIGPDATGPDAPG
ncbi:LuxR C-terminal-related transcriptional regulator [Micromonospora sp. DT47]|uniref:LuxR C-terminal-related transcriptional regulator n=1 Tax=Micromonospora sp. DT47 TaxID=3393431 RepID=UPI003CED9CEF